MVKWEGSKPAKPETHRKVVRVTPSQVKTAQDQVERDSIAGRKTDPAVWKIANAHTVTATPAKDGWAIREIRSDGGFIRGFKGFTDVGEPEDRAKRSGVDPQPGSSPRQVRSAAPDEDLPFE